MKFYITTSIPYVNGAPHIGHALEMVQADAIARFYRQRRQAVFFLTGTDEHGTKIARAAEIAGKNTQDFVDGISGQFRNFKDGLNEIKSSFVEFAKKALLKKGFASLFPARFRPFLSCKLFQRLL